MIRDRNTEKFEIIPLRDKKRPLLPNWKNRPWDQRGAWSGQVGVGMMPTIHGATLDCDHVEYNERIDRELGGACVLLKSGSGKRHMRFALDEDSWSVPNCRFYDGDRHIGEFFGQRGKQTSIPNFWGYKELTDASQYQLLNATEEEFFNPPTFSLFKVLDVLGFNLRTTKDEIVKEVISQPPEIIAERVIRKTLTRFTGFDLRNHIPTSKGSVNANMGSLLGDIYDFGMWDQRDNIFLDYLSRIPSNLKTDSDQEYFVMWNGWKKFFNKEKRKSIFVPMKDIPFDDIVVRHLLSDTDKPNHNLYTIVTAKKGKGGHNRDDDFIMRLYNICLELGSYTDTGDFFMTTDWTKFAINKMKVLRGLKYLESISKIKLIKKGGLRQGRNIPSRYKLLKEDGIKP